MLSLDTSGQAALRSECLPGAAGFLTATPSKPLGLVFKPEEFVDELKARLLAPLFGQDNFCPSCDAIMDRHGYHARMCACDGDRTARHNAARNLVARYARSAGLGPEVERANLLPQGPMTRPGRIDAGKPTSTSPLGTAGLQLH